MKPKKTLARLLSALLMVALFACLMQAAAFAADTEKPVPRRAGNLTEPETPLVGPVTVPAVFSDGAYRRVANAEQLKGEGRFVYTGGGLTVWPVGEDASREADLDFEGADLALHYFLESIGVNSTIRVEDGSVTAVTIRPPTFGTTERNAMFLTADFLGNMRVTVACNPTQSPDGGAVTPTETTVIVSDTITELFLDLRGEGVKADADNDAGITLDEDGRLHFAEGLGDGASARFSVENADGGLRSFTVTVGGDGTISFFYTVG